MIVSQFEHELSELLKRHGLEMTSCPSLEFKGPAIKEAAIPGPIMPANYILADIQPVCITIRANFVGPYRPIYG